MVVQKIYVADIILFGFVTANFTGPYTYYVIVGKIEIKHESILLVVLILIWDSSARNSLDLAYPDEVIIYVYICNEIQLAK